jgi:transposase
LVGRVKIALRRLRRDSPDKGLAMRCQIVLLVAKGRARPLVAEAVGCSVSWVNRVVARFDQYGVAGLMDRREDNGQEKLDEYYLATLYELVEGSPQAYGYPRPTWTRELLVKVMFRLTGVRVHPATMSRALARIGARLGRPRPRVGCPWSERRKNQRLAEIGDVLDTLGPHEVAVYLDEVDIHLNPKIGPDWMNRGKQKEVMTPGKNVKNYVCGALDVQTGQITWVQQPFSKNSFLFIAMLRKLAETYSGAQKIHIVLDNYRIHDSKISQPAVAAYGGKVVLHYLPPYCPDHNKIERVWLDLHANVTRNHTCRDMNELMKQVIRYIKSHNCRKANEKRNAA